MKGFQNVSDGDQKSTINMMVNGPAWKVLIEDEFSTSRAA
jgi:hypothetical protein